MVARDLDDETLLLVPGLGAFGPGHSERGSHVSMAPSLGFGTVASNAHGRWRTEAGKVYVCAARHIVETVQSRIADRNRNGLGGPDIFGEGDVPDQTCDRVIELGGSEEYANIQRTKLCYF